MHGAFASPSVQEEGVDGQCCPGQHVGYVCATDAGRIVMAYAPCDGGLIGGVRAFAVVGADVSLT
jgi:hypothetical protein